MSLLVDQGLADGAVAVFGVEALTRLNGINKRGQIVGTYTGAEVASTTAEDKGNIWPKPDGR